MSHQPGSTQPEHSGKLALGVALGMLGGGILGAIVWFSTGEFVFLPIFVGGGLTVGLGAGAALENRQQ